MVSVQEVRSHVALGSYWMSIDHLFGPAFTGKNAADCSEEEIREMLIDQHIDAQDYCCSCHVSPPCNFCVDGYSLPLDEYIELNLDEWRKYFQESDADRYDRAMKIFE